MVAATIEMLLQKRGCQVIGPFPTVSGAMAAIKTATTIDLALLDVNLDREAVYPVAEELDRKSVPYVFLTGYSSSFLPAAYRGRALLEKPFTTADFDRAMHGALARKQGQATPPSP